MTLFGLSVKNILRRPLRSAAMFFGVFSVSAILYTLSMIFISVSGSIELSRARLGADAMVVPSGWEGAAGESLLTGEPSAYYMKSSVLDSLKAERGVEALSGQLFIISAPLACCSVSDTMLIGYDPETDLTVGPWLRERLGKSPSREEIIVGSNLLAGQGGRLRFFGGEFRIAGKLEPTGMRFIDSSVYIPMEGARKMVGESGEKALKGLEIPADVLSAVFLRLGKDVNPEEFAIRLESKMPGIRVILPGEITKRAKEGLLLPIRSVSVAASLQWAASLFMIGVIYMLSLSERRREVGLLRALGSRKKDVLKMFLFEITLICGFGGISGAVFGILFVKLFEGLIKASFKTPFLSPGAQIVGVVAAGAVLLSFLTALLAALLPAVRESDRAPYHSARET